MTELRQTIWVPCPKNNCGTDIRVEQHLDGHLWVPNYCPSCGLLNPWEQDQVEEQARKKLAQGEIE